MFAGIHRLSLARGDTYRGVHVKEPVAYEDAVDLLDADHKAVKKMFIDYNALCEDAAPVRAKSMRWPSASARR